MTSEEIDVLLNKAILQSIELGEDVVRYRFAALVAAAEREACAKACEENQFPEIEDASCEPYNAGCRHSAAAIRARGEQEQPR